MHTHGTSALHDGVGGIFSVPPIAMTIKSNATLYEMKLVADRLQRAYCFCFFVFFFVGNLTAKIVELIN